MCAFFLGSSYIDFSSFQEKHSTVKPRTTHVELWSHNGGLSRPQKTSFSSRGVRSNTFGRLGHAGAMLLQHSGDVCVGIMVLDSIRGRLLEGKLSCWKQNGKRVRTCYKLWSLQDVQQGLLFVRVVGGIICFRPVHRWEFRICLFFMRLYMTRGGDNHTDLVTDFPLHWRTILSDMI